MTANSVEPTPGLSGSLERMKRLTISSRACTEILALLIHAAWADGKLEDREKESLRAASSVLNLSKEQRERLDNAMESALPLDQILFESLSGRDKAFAFVAAVWLTGVDDDIDPKEQDFLNELASSVGFDAARRQELIQIARDVGKEHERKERWADDIVALFKAIPARLENVEDDVEIAFEG